MQLEHGNHRTIRIHNINSNSQQSQAINVLSTMIVDYLLGQPKHTERKAIN